MTQPWNNGVDDDVQMPLNTGTEPAPAEEYSKPSRLKVNTSTLMLVGAFATALAALYLLGLHNKPRAASAEEKARALELDKKLEVMLNTKSAPKVEQFLDSTSRLIEMLNGYFKTSAATANLPGNPFEKEAIVRVVDPTPTNPAITLAENDDGPELREAAEEFAGLKLQMVMTGTPPTALINGKLVRVGMTLKKLTVIEIDSDHVIMGWKTYRPRLDVNAPQLPK